MKQLTMILAATMIFMTLGCEKRVGQAKDADKYDEKIDGPVCVLTVSADENLLADQKKISRQARIDAESVESEEKADDGDTAPLPAGDAISAVKQVLSDAITAAKSGQTDQMLSIFTKADAKAIKPLLVTARELPVKIAKLEKLVQDKLGIPLPDKMKKDIGVTGGMPMLGGDLAYLNIDQIKFETDGDKVVVTDPENPKTIFVNTSEGWKVELKSEDREMLDLFGEMSTAIDKAFDEITSGINNGDITKANFESKFKEIGEKHLEPVMEKFGKMMAEAMKEAFESAKPPTVKPSAVPSPRPDERGGPERRRPGGPERHGPGGPERRRPEGPERRSDERGGPERREHGR